MITIAAIVPADEFDNLCRVIGESDSLACKEALYKLRRRAEEQIRPNIGHKAQLVCNSVESDLTAREKEIAELVCDGLTSEDIAELLDVSIKTIGSSRSRIYRKMGVRNAAGLVAKLKAQ